jgi:hypothetical protein
MSRARSAFPLTGATRGRRMGASQASVVGDTKAEVQRRTVELAKQQPLGQVKIHGRDGKIQEERTYGKNPGRHPG